VLGAVAAIDRMNDPQLALPVPGESWLAPGADVFLADGSTPLQAVLELRAARTGGAAPPADGFEQDRLAAYALVDGRLREGAVALARRGPGVWLATVTLPAGLGGSQLTIGATFDGAAIVDAKTLPIATDEWTAEYPVTLRAGCGVDGSPVSGGGPFAAVGALGIVGLGRRRGRRRTSLVDDRKTLPSRTRRVLLMNKSASFLGDRARNGSRLESPDQLS